MGQTILTTTQKKIINFLVKDQNFASNFILTGGTALAEYYLHHRYSEDLDFFSEREIDELWLITLTKKLKTSLKIDKIDFQKSFNRNLIFLKTGDEIIKAEFTYFPFTAIEKPKIDEGLKIDSLLDLAVNKFFTLYQKPAARHFIDLYLILKEEKIFWEKLFSLARIKFDTVIDPLQLGTSLFQAKDIAGLPKMIVKLDEKNWRNYFCEKALKLKPRIKNS